MSMTSDILDQVDEAFRLFVETASRMDSVLKSGERLLIVKKVRASANRADLNEVCAEAREALGITTCLVTLLDDHTSQVGGTSDQVPVDYGDYPVSKTVCQYVVASGYAVEITDAATYCATTPGIDGMSEAGMLSYHGEPVLVFGEVVGSLCAMNIDPHDWTDDERVAMKGWAGVVGVLFERDMLKAEQIVSPG